MRQSAVFWNPQHSALDTDRRERIEKLEAALAGLLREIEVGQVVGPLQRISTSLPDLDQGYHDVLYRWLTVPYSAALSARDQPALIAEIHQLMPARTKRYEPEQVLRHCLQIAGQGFRRGTTAYALACERERALRDFFERGVEARDLPRLIEEAGGIGALDDRRRVLAVENETDPTFDANTGDQPGSVPAVSTGRGTRMLKRAGTDPAVSGDGGGGLEERADGDDLAPPTPTKRGRARRSHKFNPDRHLAVEMPPAVLQWFAGLPPGPVTITVMIGEHEADLVEARLARISGNRGVTVPLRLTG